MVGSPGIILYRFTVTTRDVLMWVEFMNQTSPPLSPFQAFYHGAQMVFVDSFGCGGSCDDRELKHQCEDVLSGFCDSGGDLCESQSMEIDNSNDVFGIHPFYIRKGTKMATCLFVTVEM